MDRDPGANAIDPEERKTPSTGESPYGTHGADRMREAEEQGDDVDQGTQPPEPAKVPLNPD